MKNLLKKSTTAVVILSLFAVSCKKADIALDNIPAANALETSVTWVPKGSTTPITTSGDIKNGDVGVPYKINPTLSGDFAKCGGTWSLTVDAPPNAQYAAPFSAAKGYVTFTPLTAGTYKLKLTYKCPCGTSISITITITVS